MGSLVSIIGPNSKVSQAVGFKTTCYIGDSYAPYSSVRTRNCMNIQVS